MLLEPIDVEFWQSEALFTAWQAAFAMCNIEPWDEPISSNSTPPKEIEEMRARLLAHIPHHATGDIFALSGWSCKTQRPAQLFGEYFSRCALKEWATKSHSEKPLPLFLKTH